MEVDTPSTNVGAPLVSGFPQANLLEALTRGSVARALTTAIASPDQWVHRRVESVQFVDAVLMTRRVSIDFTADPALLPEVSPEVALVPLALLHKRPLTGLDVTSSAGVPVPILTSAQNAALVSAMVADYGALLAGSVLPAPVTWLIDRAVRFPPDAARTEAAGLDFVLRHRPQSDPSRAVLDEPSFVGLLHQFIDNFLLVGLVPLTPGRRQIVKFAYIDQVPGQRPSRRSDRLAETLGWRARAYNFDVPAATWAESVHFEVRVPEGLAVSEAAFIGKPSASLGDDGLDVVEIDPDDHQVVHLHAPADRNEFASAVIWIRVASVGWLRVTRWTGWGLAALATMTATRVSGLDGPTASGRAPTDVAAILTAVVAVVGTLLTRPGEHAATARVVFGARLVSMISITTIFLGAWIIAFGPRGSALTAIWWGIAAVTIVAACVLQRTRRSVSRARRYHRATANRAPRPPRK